MKREQVTGFVLGGIAGVGYSLLILQQGAFGCLGLPGSIVRTALGFLQTALYHGPVGRMAYVAANAIFYAAIGSGVGSFSRRAREKDRPPRPVAPECAICGLKRVTSPKCPRFGYARSFARWIGAVRPALRCDKCKYDLTGNESGVCPECGEPI